MVYQTTDPFMLALYRWTGLLMHHAMHEYLGHAKHLNLSLSQLGALFRIHHDESCGIPEITGMLGVSSAAASQLLDRLVSFGLISRSEDERDRRAKRLELTDAGDRVIHQMIDARHRWIQLFAKSLTDEERGSAADTLNMLSAKLEQTEGGAP